ncbi:MAG: HDOD domain-containing protein [Bryobacteraceae bacterium]
MDGIRSFQATVQTANQQRTSRAEKLEAWVTHIRQNEGLPGFREHVKQIMGQTLDIDSSCVEIARVILRDLGITSQLLKIANSALYKHSDRPIMSVAHAIILLGWDMVRNLLSAIQFVEHFANGSSALRELMLLSVLNAVHSRDIALAAGYAHPDEAYICGLFQNLGEVLVAGYYPLEYSRVIVAMNTDKIPARAACLRILDFSWDEVGLQLAQEWNMPSKVRSCLAASCGRTVPKADQSLTTITGYARDLTHSLYRSGKAIDAFSLRCVVGPQGEQVLVPMRDLARVVEGAATEIKQNFSSLNIPMERLLLDQQAERARGVLASVPVFDAVSVHALSHAVANAKRSLERKNFDLSILIKDLLDAVHEAGFDRAVFGLINDKHTSVRGRIASAARLDEILDRFQFPIDHAEGPILAALGRKTDLLVDRARDDRYDASALVAALAPDLFALLPIVTGRVVAGCLYADRKGSAKGLDDVRVPLGRVRDVIAEAIRKKATK